MSSLNGEGSIGGAPLKNFLGMENNTFGWYFPQTRKYGRDMKPEDWVAYTQRHKKGAEGISEP